MRFIAAYPFMLNLLIRDFPPHSSDTPLVRRSESSLHILTQLFRGKTVEEKELAVNMLKLLFSYTDGKI